MRRRGVEMSLNLVIMIVLGLIILSLLIFLGTRYITGGDQDLSNCVSKGGRCDTSCNPGESTSSLFTGGCPNEDDVCCMKTAFGA
jgi:hypothetical protein